MSDDNKIELLNLNKADSMTLIEWANEVHNLAKLKGWHSDDETIEHFINRTCNNITGEVSELWEAFRNSKLHQFCDKAQGMKDNGDYPLSNEEEELADIVIRALDAMIKRGINPIRAIGIKHRYNQGREFRHGGKAA